MDLPAATAALSALAHPDRLRAFRLIAAGDPLPSGRVAERLDMPPTRASFHLTTLERAGLLSAARHGREVRYAVVPAAMRALMAFLAEDCCGGRPDLCLPKDAR
ncbi:helix-turn-helix transcriptional regulator [Jannaschia sp. Os4]|uniref:ArsR/SmtB family transcription factor n=1 Tax=Jannaschia sp. Os4 TaxID=2807617 RepID=UPI0019399657|nr:metalloregulator ArsR/SmtB family transcription factor [Jannaschia sp. Os4]MBM2575292.1 helix-turn-helix transcriptional regulator [Jannaschia sp. Os4]